MLTPIQVKRNKAFIAALRSGKYKQARRMLRSKIGGRWHYCCLGVACELRRVDTGEGKWTSVHGFDDIIGYPPITVSIGYYGWPSDNPVLPTNDGSSEMAAKLNDDRKWDFTQIADAFEAWLKKNTPKRKPATQKVARKKTSL